MKHRLRDIVEIMLIVSQVHFTDIAICFLKKRFTECHFLRLLRFLIKSRT